MSIAEVLHLKSIIYDLKLLVFDSCKGDYQNALYRYSRLTLEFFYMHTFLYRSLFSENRIVRENVSVSVKSKSFYCGFFAYRYSILSIHEPFEKLVKYHLIGFTEII